MEEPAAQTPSPAAAAPTPPTKVGVLLRVLIFAFLAIAAISLIGPLLAPVGYLLGAVLSTFAAAAMANALALRIWERAHLADIGLYWNAASWRHLLLGLAGGAGSAVVVLGGSLLVGAARLEPSLEADPSWGTLLFVTFILLFGVIGEEVLFRGYAFQVMAPVFGTWATVLPMGVLFGLAHSTNEGARPLALFNTMAWGVLLGWAVLRSGDLWLAIGLHFGWNWTLPLFGVNLSGFNIRVTGYSMNWTAGELWSGGNYGPEAGLLCTIILGALIAFLWKAPIIEQTLPLVRRAGEQGL
jgi:membrane protease YdiL (CAAX protease family)